MLNYLDELYAKSKNDVNKDNDITNAESDDDDQENVVEGIIERFPHLRRPDPDDKSDEEVQKKPSIKDKLFSYIPNLGSYTDFMSGFSDTFGFQEEVYEVNMKEFNKCVDNNIPSNNKIVGIFDNQCVWLDDNNEIKTTVYNNKDTLLDENKNTTNTNEGNAENELSDELKDLRDKINEIELTDNIKNIKNFNRGLKNSKGKDEWENAIKTALYSSVYYIIEKSYKLTNINKDNYHKYMNHEFIEKLYDKLEDMKDENVILNTIKDYFTNDNILRTIQDKVTKYINENKQIKEKRD